MHSDAFNKILCEQLTDPATASTTVTSSSTDLAGAEGAVFRVFFGESGDTLGANVYWNAVLWESDDDSTFTAVDDDDVTGSTTNSFGLVNAAADDDAVYSLGYHGIKRYVKVIVTATGTHTYGTPICIAVDKFYLQKTPSGQAVNP